MNLTLSTKQKPTMETQKIMEKKSKDNTKGIHQTTWDVQMVTGIIVVIS